MQKKDKYAQRLYFSVLLLAGLIASQFLPSFAGKSYKLLADIIRMLTMTGLAFIMIRVGYEFDIDKSNIKQYGWDYFVAFTAASFPWIFVTAYFVFVLLPPEIWSNPEAWKETLLAGRFAAPTSAGVLFSMLAAAGLGATWLYRKARILAIFDDLDTVLLMIPLKMLMIGLAWQLGVVVFIMVIMIWLGYAFLHKIRIPVTWGWVLSYAVIITAISEVVYKASKIVDESVPIHIEVLLPAFILGCIMAYPKTGDNPNDLHAEIETPTERKVASIIAGIFMVLVGLSMPQIFNASSDYVDKSNNTKISHVEQSLHAAGSPLAEKKAAEIGSQQNIGRITKQQPTLSWSMIALHVLLVTLLSNIGKMFPLFCYRREAHWRERLAVSIGMWPRGEVGAGVLVISLSYGIGGPIVTIAMLSLALNLLLTGFFIVLVKRITNPLDAYNASIANG